MIALSLGRRKPFFTVLSCDCRLSLATGPGKLQVQPRPQCPESDRSAAWPYNDAMCQEETPALQHKRIKKDCLAAVSAVL